jgi:AcrR family transcriptional regulator
MTAGEADMSATTAMTTTETAAKRGRGRPRMRSDEETLGVVVEAANQEFLANGYAATGMEAVACRAAVSTKTLYRLVPTKAALFERVVTARLDRFVESMNARLVGRVGLSDSLEALLAECAGLALDAEVLAFLRLVVAERGRFPEIATALYQKGMRRTGAALTAWIRLQSEHGLIAVEDPELAAGMLLGMMISEPQRAALLGQAAPPGEAEIQARAKACARLFLQGCERRDLRCVTG